MQDSDDQFNQCVATTHSGQKIMNDSTNAAGTSVLVPSQKEHVLVSMLFTDRF